jgi:hypothetical protein
MAGTGPLFKIAKLKNWQKSFKFSAITSIITFLMFTQNSGPN